MQVPDAFLAHTGPLVGTCRPTQGENSDVTLLMGTRGRFILKQATTVQQVERSPRRRESWKRFAAIIRLCPLLWPPHPVCCG